MGGARHSDPRPLPSSPKRKATDSVDASESTIEPVSKKRRLDGPSPSTVNPNSNSNIPSSSPTPPPLGITRENSDVTGAPSVVTTDPSLLLETEPEGPVLDLRKELSSASLESEVIDLTEAQLNELGDADYSVSCSLSRI